MSLHFLEHGAERRALETGTGPVVEWLAKRVGLLPEQAFWPLVPALDQAAALGVLGPDVLLVHLTDARPDELRRIAEAGAKVVLCPRSNLYIETKLPPLLAVLEAGLEPALGTDSLASNTTLDVLAEAVSLAERFPSVPAEGLLRMATWNGAQALRRPDLGRLVRGAKPGVVALDLPPGAKAPATGGDVAALVRRHAKAPRRWVVRRTPS